MNWGMCLGKQRQRVKELLQDGELDINNSDGLKKKLMGHILACKKDIIEMFVAAGVPLFPRKRNKNGKPRNRNRRSPLQNIALIFGSSFAKFEARLVHTTVATSSPQQLHLKGLQSLYSKLCLIRAGLEIQKHMNP